MFFKKFRKINGKAPALQSLFGNFTTIQSTTLSKESPTEDFSCEYCEIIQNNFFADHLQVTISEMSLVAIQQVLGGWIRLDTGRKLNGYKTFRRSL